MTTANPYRTSVRLPDVLTHVTPADVFHALGRAWPEAVPDSLLVLLAQWAEETGRGNSMHCFNLGNVKRAAGDGQCWTFFACDENLGGKTKWFYPDDPACCFVAFTDLNAGVAFYLNEMRRKFASAWPSVLAGDPAAFVQHLKAAHYFTAAEGPYESSVVSIFREFRRQLVEQPGFADTGPAYLRWVQSALIAAGFDPGAVDGLPGPKTTAAVRRFQASRLLSADGIVGPKTDWALKAVLPHP